MEKLKFKRIAAITALLIFASVIFLFGKASHTRADSGGDENDSGDFQVINTNPSNDQPKKPQTKTITTQLAPTVTQQVTTTTTFDSDGDGQPDNVDPTPTINDNFIVKDANLDGIDDRYEMPEQLAHVGAFGTGQKVNYHGQVIVDSDLDGLTDQGELQIYHTDPGKPDSDGDGYLDGAEILAGTNSNDPKDYPGYFNIKDMTDPILQNLNAATPWAWYVGRAAGMIGFIFLWITVFLGLSIRNPILKKIVAPIYSFDFHCFAAAASIFWSLVHGTAFLFDGTLGFDLKDIAVPFYSKTIAVDPNFLGLGILAFYAMVIMTITSYLRQHLNHWLWRVLHFLNPLAFIFVVAHGYVNGTDMKNFYVGSAFLFSSFLLVLIYLSSLVAILINKIRQRNNNNFAQ